MERLKLRWSLQGTQRAKVREVQRWGRRRCAEAGVAGPGVAEVGLVLPDPEVPITVPDYVSGGGCAAYAQSALCDDST